MIQSKNKQCYKCNSCVVTCPKEAITTCSSNVFDLVKINKQKCVGCGLCDKVCPINRVNEKLLGKCDVFALQTLDKNILKMSSSGGVFFEICRSAISHGYKVFASRFDEEFKLIHTEVGSIDSIYPFLGSKYLKSDTGDTFLKTKKYLNSGEKVLYIGTPCEIAALTFFLNGKPDNLFLVDFACHGAPSQIFFNKYKRELEKRFSSKIQTVNFRSKKNGWNDFSLEIIFESGKIYFCSHKQDPYMQLFLNNYSLYDSCYSCSFKGINSFSDVTIADFWTIEKIVEDFNDDEGTSLLAIKNNKANAFFEEISLKFKLKKLDYDLNKKRRL